MTKIAPAPAAPAANRLSLTIARTGAARARLILLLALLPFFLPTDARLAAATIPTDLAPAAAETSPASSSPAPHAAVAAVFRGTQGPSSRALAAALDAVACARSRGVEAKAGKDDLLTVIDYSLPSTAPRLWVLDLAHGKVLFHELVAHGAGSGDNYATRFSNLDNSRQTSLGLFLTRDTYEGGNGYSLRLQGLDQGINDLAEARKIVMHGAWYVSPDQIRRYGRIGRSWGCPALPVDVAPRVIDAIKGGSFVFAYSATDTSWRKASTRSCRPPAAPAPAAPVLAVAAAIAGR